MGVAPITATPVYTDAKAVTDGSHLERFRRSTRFMAAKYAMLRWGIACRAITLERVPATHRIADIMTKPITGAAFHALRARVLGLPQDHESASAQTLRVGILRYSRARIRDVRASPTKRERSHGLAAGTPRGRSQARPSHIDPRSADTTPVDVQRSLGVSADVREQPTTRVRTQQAVIHDISPEGEYDISPSGCS